MNLYKRLGTILLSSNCIVEEIITLKVEILFVLRSFSLLSQVVIEEIVSVSCFSLITMALCINIGLKVSRAVVSAAGIFRSSR